MHQHRQAAVIFGPPAEVLENLPIFTNNTRSSDALKGIDSAMGLGGLLNFAVLLKCRRCCSVPTADSFLIRPQVTKVLLLGHRNDITTSYISSVCPVIFVLLQVPGIVPFLYQRMSGSQFCLSHGGRAQICVQTSFGKEVYKRTDKFLSSFEGFYFLNMGLQALVLLLLHQQHHTTTLLANRELRAL